MITDAGPYLCIQKLRNANRTNDAEMVSAINEAEAVVKGLLDRIKRQEDLLSATAQPTKKEGA